MNYGSLPPDDQVPTIGELMRDGGWFRAVCIRTGCGHEAPMTYAPWAILYGLDASTNVIRRKGRCSKCGGLGLATFDVGEDRYYGFAGQAPSASAGSYRGYGPRG
jgi:hypothetical protein